MASVGDKVEIRDGDSIPRKARKALVDRSKRGGCAGRYPLFKVAAKEGQVIFITPLKQAVKKLVNAGVKGTRVRHFHPDRKGVVVGRGYWVLDRHVTTYTSRDEE